LVSRSRRLEDVAWHMLLGGIQKALAARAVWLLRAFGTAIPLAAIARSVGPTRGVGGGRLVRAQITVTSVSA